MVSIFIPTSELHVRLKFRKPREEVLADSLNMIDFARDHGVQVRFAAEDASRTDLPFLKDVYRQASDHGAVLLSFADTVGCLIPSEMNRIMSDLVSSVDRPFCAHCHNDMGCAVANTITAAEAGAFQLHTTVNGIGERSGNASLEELLVVLRMKKGIDRYDQRSSTGSLTWLKNIPALHYQETSPSPGSSHSLMRVASILPLSLKIRRHMNISPPIS